MNIKDTLLGIHAELGTLMQSMDAEAMEDVQKEIERAQRIFVAGTGRSLLMIRAFAMRLMHAGLTVYVVGETTTPAITSSDLLIIASGSGTTATMIAVAEKCKKIGARLLLITTDEESTIARMADRTLVVHAFSSKRQDQQATSIQIGANGFEQMVLLIGDALTVSLMKREGGSANEELMGRHANLE